MAQEERSVAETDCPAVQAHGDRHSSGGREGRNIGKHFPLCLAKSERGAPRRFTKGKAVEQVRFFRRKTRGFKREYGGRHRRFPGLVFGAVVEEQTSGAAFGITVAAVLNGDSYRAIFKTFQSVRKVIP